MGFTPELVGLSGERITAKFNEPRPESTSKFHIGIDISSSKTPRPFSAGVYGKVIRAGGGDYNTITVECFHDPRVIVQYLHSSLVSVRNGCLVTPGTILGMTGDTAPKEHPVTGIHLHLHIVRPSGKPLHPTWSRNFVDPETWDVGNPLVGTWSKTSTEYDIDYTSVTRRQWKISSDTIGGAISITNTCDLDYIQQIHVPGEAEPRPPRYCKYQSVAKWEYIISSRDDCKIGASIISSSCTATDSCTPGVSCIAESTIIEFRLKSLNRIEILSPNGVWTLDRVGLPRISVLDWKAESISTAGDKTNSSPSNSATAFEAQHFADEENFNGGLGFRRGDINELRGDPTTDLSSDDAR